MVFGYRNVRYYLGTRVLTVLATEMQAVAVAWQVYGLTHRPLDLGLVGLAQFLPGILLFPITGHTADRVPRQRILRACSVGFPACSLALLALTMHGLHSVIPIYLVLAANGTVRAFNGPAGQAFLPLLVPAEHFPKAVAWNSSVFQISAIAGPVLGGLLYGWSGSPKVVYVCAVCGYLGALLLLFSIRAPAVMRAHGSDWSEMALEGLRYIWRNRLILGAMSLDLFAVLLGGAVALLPVYAREILGVGAWGLGVLRSAPGVGAVITGLAVAHWPLRRRAGAVMLWSVAGFGLFTIVFGVSRNLALSLAALALTGACDTVSVIVRHTLIQLSTPNEMRGRVSAVNVLFIGASNEVGQFESGVTAHWFGTTPAVILGGIGAIVVVAVWAWLFPELRRVNTLANHAAEDGTP